MVNKERDLLIKSMSGAAEKRRHNASPFAGKDEKTSLPISEGICIEQGFNGNGAFHLSIISADEVKDLACKLTLRIEDRLAYFEGYINEGDGPSDRQIYYSLRPITPAEAVSGSNIVVRHALRVSDKDLALFRDLKKDPAGNLETAKSLLRRFQHQALR